mmetsp:Transcript_76863/g.205382  ORF Transcript_76863/g.205382 Transcript_76863/m.205382 type:complete len:368 (-) Transcript_76863:35-1138(-)
MAFQTRTATQLHRHLRTVPGKLVEAPMCHTAPCKTGDGHSPRKIRGRHACGIWRGRIGAAEVALTQGSSTRYKRAALQTAAIDRAVRTQRTPTPAPWLSHQQRSPRRGAPGSVLPRWTVSEQASPPAADLPPTAPNPALEFQGLPQTKLPRATAPDHREQQAPGVSSLLVCGWLAAFLASRCGRRHRTAQCPPSLVPRSEAMTPTGSGRQRPDLAHKRCAGRSIAGLETNSSSRNSAPVGRPISQLSSLTGQHAAPADAAQVAPQKWLKARLGVSPLRRGMQNAPRCVVVRWFRCSRTGRSVEQQTAGQVLPRVPLCRPQQATRSLAARAANLPDPAIQALGPHQPESTATGQFLQSHYLRCKHQSL